MTLESIVKNPGHPTSSLSAVEILTALYFGGVMRYDPKNPTWPQRDRFILSKGHAAPVLYMPPLWLRHVTLLLMLPVFPLIAAAYLPGRIKAAIGHPFLAAIKLWAFAHLLSNGSLADLLLFGGFLLWAVFCYRSLRQRDRAAGKQPSAGQPVPTVVAVVVGAVLWFAFAQWLHGPLIGVRPFG